MSMPHATMRAEAADDSDAVVGHAGALDSVLSCAFDMWMARRVRNVTISIGHTVHLTSDMVEAVFCAMNEHHVTHRELAAAQL